MVLSDLEWVVRTNISGKQPKNAKIYLRKKKMTPSNDFLDNLAADQHEKMLREIANDDLTPKKRDKKQETEIFENEIPAAPLYE